MYVMISMTVAIMRMPNGGVTVYGNRQSPWLPFIKLALCPKSVLDLVRVSTRSFLTGVPMHRKGVSSVPRPRSRSGNKHKPPHDRPGATSLEAVGAPAS